MMKMEENLEGINEWKDLFTGFGHDHAVKKSFVDMISGGGGNLGGSDCGNEVENSSFSGLEVSSALDDCGGGGSIAERRSRKCGFNFGKISTPRFRASNVLPSPYLTIPPGISPHLLLDSPILLPNSQFSPTTGTYTTPSFDRDGRMIIPSLPAQADYSCDGGLSTLFPADTDTTSLDTTSLASFCDEQSQQPVDFEFSLGQSEGVGMNDNSTSLPPERKFSGDLILTSNSSTFQSSGTDALVCAQMPVKNETSIRDVSGTKNSKKDVRKQSYSTPARTTEDGFNWRKYGQKQVKGSEYPRSYYKCTHPNCQVKKKVERSHDGQITEIIYKNAHNHPKPQPCRKSQPGDTSDRGNGSNGCAKIKSDSAWKNMQLDVKIGSDWQIGGLERPSSTSVVTEISGPPSEKTTLGVLESTATPEFSSTLGNYDDDEEDAATAGNFMPADIDDKEPDAKRRNTETTLSSRALRAPRVVVQIESEVDILDDGYRWRKYGQKVVKGNPNPRSYYKCTSAGCNVRKHVERASHNLKFVITTYEGKHNHEVPAAKNSSHFNSGNGPLTTAAPNTHSDLQFTRNPQHPKPEPHAHDLPPFDVRMGCNSGFLRPNFFGPGAPPFYQTKYPTLPNTSSSYNPFGFAGHHHHAYTNGIMPSIPELHMPLPLGFPHSTSNYSNPDRMLSSMQSLYPGQQLEGDVKPIMPKLEQRDESLYTTEMHNVHHSDYSSSMYNMGNFPS